MTPELRAKTYIGVFESLRDPKEFRRVMVTDGYVAWPCGVDLAPDAMHTEIGRHGFWRIGPYQPDPSTHPRIVENAVPISDTAFLVEFSDGVSGEVEMCGLLSRKLPVWGPLREPSYFRRLKVVRGRVSWPNGADIHPDLMHSSIKREGRMVLEVPATSENPIQLLPFP